MRTVSVIGIGRLGGALAIALSRSGFAIEQLIYRTALPSPETLAAINGRPVPVPFSELRSITSDIILVATGDDQIESACLAAAKCAHTDAVILHLSGALASDQLSAAAEKGLATGSMHPLASISDPVRGAEVLHEAYFCIEGTEKAVAEAEGLVRAIGGRSFTIETAFKPLYHASAVLASGHVVTLFDTAVEVLTRCGLEASRASEVLLPLLLSSVRNLSDQETPQALTGPFSRVDEAAVSRHLKSFERAGLGDIERIYIEIGKKSLELAERNGASHLKADEIRHILKLASSNSR